MALMRSPQIVSCGEDQVRRYTSQPNPEADTLHFKRICIWDFSHGVDTSFIKL